MGAGATAFSGASRAGVLIFVVTNLNNSGSGSFRQALLDAQAASQDVLKIILFNVSGYVQPTSTIQMPSDAEAGNVLRHVYVAGQSSPNGIGISQTGTFTGQYFEAHRTWEDQVWRSIRFYGGDAGTPGSSAHTFRVRSCDRLMFDHCTWVWGPGRQLQISTTNIGRSPYVRNWTGQACIFGETLDPHPSGWGRAGGANNDEYEAAMGDVPSKHASVLYNLIISNSQRNPNVQNAQYAEVIGNVHSNLQRDAIWTGDLDIHDYLNNTCYVNGPFTSSIFAVVAILNHRLWDPPKYYLNGGGPSYHVAGNRVLHPGGTHWLNDINADNWDNAHKNPNRNGSQRGIVDWNATATTQDRGDTATSEQTDGFTGLLEFRRNKRMWLIESGDREWGISQHGGEPVFPVQVMTSPDAEAFVRGAGGAGASIRLNDAGEWVVGGRDSVESRLESEVGTTNGISSRLLSMPGSVPTISSSTPRELSPDGLPKSWLQAVGADPDASDIAGTIVFDGYSLAECLINGIHPDTGAVRVAG
jgi:hypothetical protein